MIVWIMLLCFGRSQGFLGTRFLLIRQHISSQLWYSPGITHKPNTLQSRPFYARDKDIEQKKTCDKIGIYSTSGHPEKEGKGHHLTCQAWH
jgi:hypothetical protein